MSSSETGFPAMWRVGARDFDVDRFLAAFPALQPDAVFRRGERRTARTVHEISGFNLSLDEGGRPERVLSTLERLQPALDALRALEVPMSVDFGLEVGGPDHFTRSVALTPEQLSKLGELRVQVEISAYPCSGESRRRKRGRTSRPKSKGRPPRASPRASPRA